MTEAPPHHSARRLHSGGPCGRDTEEPSCCFNLFTFKRSGSSWFPLSQSFVPGVRLTGPQRQCDPAAIARKAGSRAPPQAYEVRLCVSAGSHCVHPHLGGPL